VSWNVDAHEQRPVSAHEPVRAAVRLRVATVWALALPVIIGIVVVEIALVKRSAGPLIVLLALAIFVVSVLASPLAHEVVIEEGVLSWRGVVRRGQLPVADLTEIGWTTGIAWPDGRGSVVFRDRSGRVIYVSPKLPGLTEVIDRAEELNPDLRVTLSPQRRWLIG
jgi:hypothetical protein